MQNKTLAMESIAKCSKSRTLGNNPTKTQRERVTGLFDGRQNRASPEEAGGGEEKEGGCEEKENESWGWVLQTEQKRACELKGGYRAH